jgi:hypothetical protein
MYNTFILASLDLKKKPFVVESNAFGTGLGAVLTQDGRLVAFTSKALSGRITRRCTYEK